MAVNSLAGCGPTLQEDVADLRRRVEEVAQKQAASQRSVDDVNNRLFLLEDKVDTGQVELSRQSTEAPRLPVIRIGPSQPVTSIPSDPVAANDQRTMVVEGHHSQDDRGRADPLDGRESVVANGPIEYDGAASTDAPVLRLHGRGDNLSIDRVGSDRRKRSTRSAPRNRKHSRHTETTRPTETTPKSETVAVATKANTARSTGAGDDANADAMKRYNQALANYRAGKHQQAAKQFETFVVDFPAHPYADNALYWCGECFYAQKLYNEALRRFRRVVEEHPNGNKAPAALLKMGFCYDKLEQKQDARSVLAQVVEIFPKTDVARLASEALSRL